ncbi:hypothetical protein OS493_020227 [Desmophyllum pertusum]|uniref:Uncharacterized protein n=1 Tax=Desmophyllum pertusum TaxID=174260 RepID=A0A9W9ZMW9_9CNID|nr:hypothetical protein OS493_020227 [Desmophyllum pertusum]
MQKNEKCIGVRNLITTAIVVEDEDQQDLLKMSGAIEGNIPEEMQCLWEQQKKIVSTKSKNGYDGTQKGWNPESSGYHKNKREQQPGWSREIVEWCQKAAKEKNLKECDYWGGFVIDEMKVEENVEMVVNGFVELGPLHNDMLALEGKL